jgi:hypothetical protein
MLIERIILAGFVVTADLLVPQEFQVNPPHPVPVIFVEPHEVETYCGHPKEGRILACTAGNGTIVMPNPCDYPEYKDPDSYARLMCHEKGHVNGWVHLKASS